MTAKLNNNHKYPNANHQPRQKAHDRKLTATARQDVYSELALEQKIAALPPEPHAKKQRARLQAALEKRNAPKPEAKSEVQQEAEVSLKQNKQKKYMKGSK